MLEEATLVGGQKALVHRKADCKGTPCCIHKPSNHHMKEWPQNWRQDRGIMERVCPHGIGHPDPDDMAIRAGRDSGTHGCDGCCTPPGAFHVEIEDVFTIKSAPRAGQPEGGHVLTFRTDTLPKVGQRLVQGGQSWPILGVEEFHSGCFGSSGHADHAHNVGVLVSKFLPKPEKGEARIQEESS